MKPYTTHDANLARTWWRKLAPRSDVGEDVSDGRGANPGAMARLRRARTPLFAMLHPEAIDLVLAIAPDGPPQAQERAAGLAALLAHVRQDDPGRPVAGRLGGRDPDTRVMKAARFRKLMLSAPGEARLTAFRRAVRMLSSTADVADLATAWLCWDHPTQGDRIRAEWMYRYVGANDADALSAVAADATPSPFEATENTD